MKFGSGVVCGVFVACLVSYPIAMHLFAHNLMSPEAASSQEILDHITRECEGVPIRAHNLMYYSERKNAPECWGAFTLFPEDFKVYMEGLKSQTDRYTTGGECGTFVPRQPPKVFYTPPEDIFGGPNSGPHWWLYKAVNTTTYCGKDRHIWLCCDMDNHRVFFYSNRD